MKIIDRGKVKRDENGPWEHPTAKIGAETSERRIGTHMDIYKDYLIVNKR